MYFIDILLPFINQTEKQNATNVVSVSFGLAHAYAPNVLLNFFPLNHLVKLCATCAPILCHCISIMGFRVPVIAGGKQHALPHPHFTCVNVTSIGLHFASILHNS